MAAESGGTKKPPKGGKATRRASDAARKPAKSASAASKSDSPAAKAKKSTSGTRPKAASGAASRPRRSSAARTTKGGSAAAKAGEGAAAAAKPAKAPATAPAKRGRASTAKPKRTSATKPATGTPATARRPAKRALVESTARSYFDALAARDAAEAARSWEAEGVNDLVPLGIFRGSGAVQAFFEEMFAAMPDIRFTVERIIADDKAASVQWRAAGTFTGASFQGLEPTGRRVDLRGNDLLEIEDGRIRHNTGVFDGAAFARQVGLLPAEDSGADRAIRAGFNTVTKLRRTLGRGTAR